MEEMMNNNIDNLEDRVETDVVETSISEEAIDAVETVSDNTNRIDDTTEAKVDAAIENAKKATVFI